MLAHLNNDLHLPVDWLDTIVNSNRFISCPSIQCRGNGLSNQIVWSIRVYLDVYWMQSLMKWDFSLCGH